MIYKPHLRSYATIKHVASTENKPWHATGKEVMLCAVESRRSAPLSISFALFHSQRSSYAALRESGQTLLALRHAIEFFQT